jgi:bifunctional DNA-binding transcriptional regulator/antitoxin component of YhaV-PrlF toxin-antitoxin module
MDAVLKIQKNKNITLPIWLMKRFHLNTGDYVRLEKREEGVLLKPAKLVDASQSYFWTKEWQDGEKEASRDIKKGKTKKFGTIKELMRDLEK